MIACDIHDRFEAICVYHCKICITLVSGKQLTGTADTITSNKKAEYLVVKKDDGSESVDLTVIKKVEVLDQPSRIESFSVQHG
jgi:transcriptional antiterminator Rof (Rho-off)